MWRRTTTHRVARSVALLAGILVLLGLAYWPAREIFRATGDVRLYQHYAELALKRPMELPREYPPLSAAIFVLPQLIAPTQYPIAFALLAALAVWLTVVAVDRLCRAGWLLLLLLGLGSFGTLFFRYDIFVVLLTVLAFAAATRKRWMLSQVLLAAGLALKLYPAILMPLVVLWQWRVERRLPLRSALGGGLVGLAAGVATWLAAPAEVARMLQYHRDRPLEYESVGASIAWLFGPVTIEWSFGSFNVLSPLGPALITASTVLTVALLLTLYAWFAARRISPAAAWALALMLALATSKVFSTQYLIWALPFVVIAGEAALEARHRIGYRALWGVICLLTSAGYPIGFMLYEDVLGASQAPPPLMNVVLLRNLLWLVACGLALRYLRHRDLYVGATLHTQPAPQASQG